MDVVPSASMESSSADLAAAAERLAPHIQSVLDDYSAAMCGPKPDGGGWCRVERRRAAEWALHGSQGTYLLLTLVEPAALRLVVLHGEQGPSGVGQPQNVRILTS